MSIKIKNFIFTVFSFFFCFAGNVFAEGEGYSLLAPIPTVTGGGQPDLVTYLKGLFTLAVGLSIVFAVFVIIYGGVKYTLAIVPSAKSDAKKRMTDAVLGLFMVLISSILLNTINPGLLRIGLNLEPVKFETPIDIGADSYKTDYTNRNNIYTFCTTEIAGCKETCTTPPSSTLPADADQQCQSIQNNGQHPRDCAHPYEGDVDCISQKCGSMTKIPPNKCSSGGKFTFDQGIQAQVGDESSQLSALISCMETKVPPGVGRISSISDSKITSGTHTFEYCQQNGHNGCSHTTNSCHYGGANCLGKSYAVDFGDEQNMEALRSAANSCVSGGIFLYNEGGHLHVSVGRANNCGCDQ
ncbi:hypothetical protein D4R99_01335 [bacterium]|nr:MAG: hypothetical protein D4R99_01335 [bacterium]